MSNLKELLVVTDEEIALVRKHYQKSETDIKKDVDTIKEWLRQQPHLPDDEEEFRLERIFLKNKCRLEQTKKKLDKYYSNKMLYPEILDIYDLNSASIQNTRKSVILVPMPKLTNKQERVFLFKMINNDTFCGTDYCLYLLMMIEFCNTYDYSLANMFIIDWEGFKFSSIKKIGPSVLQKYVTIAVEIISDRFSTVHFINAPNFVGTFLEAAKVVFNPKIFSKIKNNSSIENIYTELPKEMFPLEYGGKEKSIYKLYEEWGMELECHRNIFIKMSKRISNEELRIEKLPKNDLFGTDGSFRNISVD